MGREAIGACGATSNEGSSRSPQGNRAGGPKLGDTLYGEPSGLNPVSVFIEPIQVPSGTNRIIHGDLAKIRARIHRFQLWVEDAGGMEGGGIAPTSSTGSHKPKGTFLSFQKLATDMRLQNA